jgi:hypothetical protein
LQVAVFAMMEQLVLVFAFVSPLKVTLAQHAKNALSATLMKRRLLLSLDVSLVLPTQTRKKFAAVEVAAFTIRTSISVHQKT